MVKPGPIEGVLKPGEIKVPKNVVPQQKGLTLEEYMKKALKGMK